MLPVRQIHPYKFKDKEGRNRLVLDLKKVFGFLPEIIIIDKALGRNNVIQVHAVLTDEEIKRENDRKKNKGVVKRNIK